jgi:photosystem II stability/assembly factor-like uncharacterized protein
MVKRSFIIAVACLLALMLLGFVSDISAQEALPPSPLAGQTWVRLGGPPGGLGYDIRMHPHDPDIMYVTDGWAGVHMSTDGGMTWFAANEGIDGRTGPSNDAIPVFCLTIDPNDPDIIWAGLQYLGFLYRSEDGGQTWERRSNGIVEAGSTGLTFRGIAVEPGDSDVVYAAAEVSSWVWAGRELRGRGFDLTQGVVYQSVDGGLSWRAIWRGDSLARYILIDPTNVDNIYISTGIFDREAANSDPETGAPGGEGVLRTTDGGQTWTPVNEGLENLYIGSLFMHPENPQILLAGAGNLVYAEGDGVYLTTDGGEHWERVLEARIITSVEFSESDPNIAYAGGQDTFYRSDDGGWTWRQFIRPGTEVWGPEGTLVGWPIDFQVDPRDPMRIFSNHYGGSNFLSEDGGETVLLASTGYTGAELRDVAVDPENPAVVYANGRSGPFMSPDGGRTWRGINTTAEHIPAMTEGTVMAVDPHDPMNLLMSSSQEGQLFESPDGGAAWRLAADYWDEIQASWTIQQGLQSVAFAPSEPGRVYGGFGAAPCIAHGERCDVPVLFSLLTSDDGGRSWTRREGTPVDTLTVTAIVVHPTDANMAWAAAAGGGIFRTSDGGETWEPASDGLETTMVMTLAGDPSNSEILYAGGLDSGLYRSMDWGASWQPSGTGMEPNEPIGAIVVDPVRPNVVYAGGWRSGVYLSEDFGTTWRLINDGLRTRSVRALAIASDGETLYAATSGEGVFRLSTLSQSEFDALAPEVVEPAPVEEEPAPAEEEPAQVEEAESPEPPSSSTEGACPSSFVPLAAIPIGLVAFVYRRKR